MLKKCYFEIYRFSEDLDYTLTDANHVDEKFLTARFKYDFSEVFAEKIRALSERARPRDLYDVIHLYNHASGENPAIIFDVLKKKCQYKAIPVPTMELMAKHPKLHELESEWSNMLSHQVSMLPPRKQFWKELPNMFAWLHEVR